MKRALALLMALVVAASVAACADEEEERQAEDSATPSAGPVSITFWHAMSAANENTLKALTERFNASQNEVRVKIIYQGTYEDNLAKLLAARGSGNVPALVQVHDVTFQFMVDSGMVRPVEDFVGREGYGLSDFEPRIIDYYTLDDTLWAMPFNVSNPILYYNKLDFEKVGLDPDKPPSTLEEIRQYCEKLTVRSQAGSTTRYCMALDVKPWYIEQILAKWGDLYVNNGNGRDARPTEAVFNGPKGKELFQWWHDMVADGHAMNVGRNPTDDQHFLAVGSGLASMTIGTSAALRSIVDLLEDPGTVQIAEVKLGTGSMPGFEGSKGATLVGGGALWILKDRPEREQEAAWKFIKYLVEPEQQADWYAGSGYFPIRLSAYDLPAAKDVEAKYPHFRVAVEQFLGAPSNRATQGALLGPFVEVRLAVQDEVEAMLLRGKDPAQAADDAARKATEIIENYERRLGR
ncbi:MAG: ABC transporter substrate-binding protein [Dehalococcoidia bacterium]